MRAGGWCRLAVVSCPGLDCLLVLCQASLGEIWCATDRSHCDSQASHNQISKGQEHHQPSPASRKKPRGRKNTWRLAGEANGWWRDVLTLNVGRCATGCLLPSFSLELHGMFQIFVRAINSRERKRRQPPSVARENTPSLSSAKPHLYDKPLGRNGLSSMRFGVFSMVWLVNRILVLRYQRLTVTRKRVTTKPSLAWLGHVFLKRRRGGKHEPREEQEILTPWLTDARRRLARAGRESRS